MTDYTQDVNTVRCTFCGRGLTEGPREESAPPHSSECPFAYNRTWGNFRFGENQPPTSNVRVCPTYAPIKRYSSYGIQFREGKEKEYQSLTSVVCEKLKPVYSMLADETKRLRTFNRWPIALKTRPRALCEAGFYYTGSGDLTRCFQCGVGVCGWKDDDDPWTAHSKYSPECAYVLTVKGVTEPSVTATSFGGDTEEFPKTITSGNESELAPGSCQLCNLTERTTVFLPCAHLVSCVACATKLTSCPVCGGDIKATLRVFLVN